MTDENGSLRARQGYIQQEIFDTVLLFPEIFKDSSEFTFTYLHPGEYYLTVVADLDEDQFPGAGDLVSHSRKITVEPGAHPEVRVDGLSR